MTCCGAGRRGGEERRDKSAGGTVAVAKLTPHSPDQCRQVGRRDGPAHRAKKGEHTLLNKHRRRDKRREEAGGWTDGRRDTIHSECVCVLEEVSHVSYLGGDERRSSRQHEKESGDKKERSSVKWHFGTFPTTQLTG